MELRHLRYFVAVAEELNFTRAAERLCMAQPPLSAQIRQLEEELGAQLFERGKRSVYLTQAGRHFLERSRAILAAVESAKEEVRSAAGGEIGRLSIGFSASSILTGVLPAALRTFQTDHPSVELRMHEMPSMHQIDGIHQRSLDIGIVRKQEIRPPVGVAMEEWYSAPLIAALPKNHGLRNANGVNFRDLKDFPLIVFPKDGGNGLYWKVLSLCAEAGFRPRLMHEARDAATMVGLVAAGFGVAILPSDSQCIRQEGVLFADILDKSAISRMYLAYRDDDSNPHLERLLSCLRQATSTQKRNGGAGADVPLSSLKVVALPVRKP